MFRLNYSGCREAVQDLSRLFAAEVVVVTLCLLLVWLLNAFLYYALVLLGPQLAMLQEQVGHMHACIQACRAGGMHACMSGRWEAGGQADMHAV